jgi:hypothetical protein
VFLKAKWHGETGDQHRKPIGITFQNENFLHPCLNGDVQISNDFGEGNEDLSYFTMEK